MLHYPRRHAPEDKPVHGAQPFGPHHDQIGLLLRGCSHNFFGRHSQRTQELGSIARLDQPLRRLLHDLAPDWTSQGLTDTCGPIRHRFERLWTYTAQMAVSTGAIVEGLDLVVYLSLGDFTGLIDSLLNPLLLQAAKK